MKHTKIFGNGMVLLAMTLLLTSSVIATGVSSPAFPGNPEEVFPGKEGTISLTIQNMASENDVIMRAELKDDPMNIVTNKNEIEKDYDVLAGTKDTEVLVKYKTPENIEIGEEFSVILSFGTVTDSTSGGVMMGIGMDTLIPFKVVPESPAPPATSPPAEDERQKISSFLLIATTLLLIVILIVIIIRRNKRKAAASNI